MNVSYKTISAFIEEEFEKTDVSIDEYILKELVDSSHSVYIGQLQMGHPEEIAVECMKTLIQEAIKKVAEDIIEPNYEIQIIRELDGYCIDSLFVNAQSIEEAQKLGLELCPQKYYNKEYRLQVEYYGELNSDRGYEMNLDKNL